MPLFGRKFAPMKCPPRKKLPFHTKKVNSTESYEHIKIKLNGSELIFHEGAWKLDSQEHSNLIKENEFLNALLTKLREENNLLKLKHEVLLDMLAEQAFVQEKGGGEPTRMKTSIIKKQY